MRINHFVNILKLFSFGIFLNEINTIKANNEISFLNVEAIINGWDSFLDRNEKIIIGCFDSDTSFEYKNFKEAINIINNLETKQLLLSSKRYSVVFDTEQLNNFFEKNNLYNIYIETSKILVIRRDGISDVLGYEYSADKDFSVTSIKDFIIENSSEFMTDLENVHLIDNNYYFIDFDNKASIYSFRKPFLFVNMRLIDKNKYTKDIYAILRKIRSQFNVIYTYQNNNMLPPFEQLKYSPLTIIYNNKKEGLEIAYDKSKFSESYILTFYNYMDNRVEEKSNFSYDNLVDFFNKYNNNTLIPQKPKMHFETQYNNKVIEFKFQDYIMELNLKNFVEVTGDVFKDVYVLIYYPWSEDYEKIKPIWNELAKNLYSKRNNIVLASYNVLDNEVLNTNFKNRNDYPEIVLYKSQINDIENNKKKILMYRREAGFSYESLASWISYSSSFNVIIPFNVNNLNSRIENQGYPGNNAEYIFDKDKYLNYMNNEHLAPKLNNEDLQEMRITSTYYSYQSKTAELHSKPTYTSYKDPPPIPDPIPKAPENLFYKTFIFDDEAVLSIGIKIPYAEYPPKYVGAKEIKERIVRDDIKREKKKEEAKKLAMNTKQSTLNRVNNKISGETLDTMNVNSKQVELNKANNAKNIKLNEVIGNSKGSGAKIAKLNVVLKTTQDSAAKQAKLNEANNAKNIRLNEAIGNSKGSDAKIVELNKSNGAKFIKLNTLKNPQDSDAKQAKLNEVNNAKNIKLNEDLTNSKSKQNSPSFKDYKKIGLNKALGNSKVLNKRNTEYINIDLSNSSNNNNVNYSISSTTIHLPNN